MADQDRLVIQSKLNDADASLPGTAIVAEHTKGVLKGMNDHAAAEYNKQVGQFSPAMIRSRRAAINKAGYSKFKEDLTVVATAMLGSGRIDTLEDFREQATAMGGIAVGFDVPALQGGIESEEIMRSVVMKIANTPGHPAQSRAARLLLEKDPITGINMANRYSEQATKIKNDIITNDKKFRTLEGARVIQDFDVKVAAVAPDDSKGLVKVWSDLQAAYNNVGGNKQASGYVSIKKDIARKLAKNSGAGLDLAEFVDKGTLRGPDSKKSMLTSTVTPSAVKFQVERKFGSTAKRNQFRSDQLRDVNKIVEARRNLRALTANNKTQGINDYVASGDGALARAALMFSDEELPAIWPKILENWKNIETANRIHPFQSMIADAKTSTGAKGRATEGQQGEKEALKEVWDGAPQEFKDKFFAEHGFISNDQMSFADLPTVMKRVMIDGLNVGAILTADTPNSREKSIEFATRRLTDSKFAVAREGNINVPIVRDTNNKFPPLTSKVAENMADALREGEDAVDALSGRGGIPVDLGFREDTLTRFTGSYGMTVANVAGIHVPFSLSPGKHEISNEMMGSKFMRNFERVGPGKNDTTIIIVPKPEVNPDDTTQAVAHWMDNDGTGSTGWAFNPQSGQWSARVRPSVGDAPPGFLERLMSNRKPTPMRSDLNKASLEAKRAAAKEVEDTQIGVFVPGDLATPPVQNVISKDKTVDRDTDNLVKESLLAGGIASGDINPRVASKIRESEAFETNTAQEVYDMADKLTKEEGGFMALGPNWNKNVSDFVIEREVGTQPYKQTVYPDPFNDPKTGRLNNAKAIGYGFNLANKNADKMLKAVGAPTKKQLLDGASITETQAVALTQFMIDKNTSWLLNHFEGVAMNQNQWIALTSLAYNSKWNKNGPTLIGPNLTKHIKRGDWAAAEEEIRLRSGKVDNPAFKEGIRLRREIEANMFGGSK
jgi:GH24 family phage-related lysozyme (muramidase)